MSRPSDGIMSQRTDQQLKHRKAEIRDLSAQPSGDQKIDVNEYKLRTQMKKNQNLIYGNMSEEELKIRGELESEIERNLEEEIKDGIYHLALKLHRLYQHKKERKAQAAGDQSLDSGDQKNNKTLSEVNISIRMEGGTKIEIKEMKKEAPEYKGRPWSSRSENVRVSNSNNKKFDWANSLRSGSDPTTSIINRNHRSDNTAGSASSLKRKGSVNGVDNRNKVHEVGWK